VLPHRLLGSLREHWRLTRPQGPLVFPGKGPSRQTPTPAIVLC
jgi:hypothetical protein